MSNHEQIIFCRDLTDDPEEARRTKAYFPTVFDESEEVIVQYDLFMHEAEVFIYPLVNAVEEGKMTADEAREMFEPYQELMPELYDPDEMELYENGFISMDWLTDWGVGPGTTDFWQTAGKLGIEGVYANEGEHPGGNPVFYIYRKEALRELQEALSGRYKIVVRDQREYDTSLSSDPEEARRIIEQARNEPEGEPV